MRKSNVYESDDGKVTVKLIFTKEDNSKLNYISIIAGPKIIHIQPHNILEVSHILGEISQLYHQDNENQ